ncbi:hypothetical protein ACYQR9_15320 [Methylobacterium sp. CM6241]
MFSKNDTAGDKIASFEWLVENRSRNQKSTLDIYKLIAKHKSKIDKNKKYRAVSQSLLGIAFSLWRSVFLADLKQEKGTLMDDVEKFLIELIQNNAIGYAQDRNNRDWSYRYYMKNARERLKALKTIYGAFGFSFNMPGETKGMTPQQWWVLHQVALDAALVSFDEFLRGVNPVSRPRTKKRPENSK